MNAPLLHRLPKPQRLFVHQDTLEEITNPQNFQFHRRLNAPVANNEVIVDAGGISPIDHKRRLFMKELPHYIRQSTEDAVNLPLQASHGWRDLALLILFGHIVGAALPQITLLFLPLPSVNAGLDGNRLFVYGVMTFYELMITSAFVATFYLAMSQGSIPLHVRIAAVATGVSVAKLFDAFIAECWFMSKQAIFPIPFSIIGSVSVALPFAFATIYVMLPNKAEIATRQKFWRCLLLIVSIIVSIDIAILWAVVLVILRGSKWQKAWAFAFEILKIFCRNILVGQIALRVNPKKLVALQFVVEIIFTGTQITSLAYIQGLASFLVLLVSTPLSLFFRYYAGHDRLMILLCYSSKKAIRNAIGDTRNDETVQQHFGSNHVLQVASGLITMSRSQVHVFGMALEQAQGKPQLHADWSERAIERIGGDNKGIERTVNEDVDDEECPTERLAVDDCASHTSDIESYSDAVSVEVESAAEKNLMPVVHDVDDGLSHSRDDHAGASKCDCAVVSYSSPITRDGESTTEAESASEDDALHMMEQGQSVIDEMELSYGGDSSRAIQDCGESVNGLEPLESCDSHFSLSHTVRAESEEEQRRLYREYLMAPIEEAEHVEESPDQRQLYNTVDAVGSELLATIIRVQFLIAIVLGRSLPIRKHVNHTYDVPDVPWRNGIIYGWVLVIVNVLMIAFFSRAFRGHEGDRKLTMSGIVSYVFRNNFWIIFLWLAASGILANFVRINHFGADFSFEFVWLLCRSPGEMAWPGCVIN